jgi:peptidyl-prolyl cis-trans isomerase B (cyclophilin B)
MLLTCFSFCFSANKEDAMTKPANPIVLMKTNKGDIKIELYADKAPVSVKNFLEYVNNGHYNGTIFHRVIDGFMIQGGGFTKDMKQKGTLPAIANEADNGLKNDRGTLAMARTSDINSATAQFFINVKDNDFLNFRSKKPSEYGYAVFGKVIDGMNVVDAIKGVKTSNKGMQSDVPVDAVEILDVSIVK